MTNQVCLSLPLLLLSVLIPLLLSNPSLVSADEVGESLVTKTCNRTEYPDICKSTLESDPRSHTENVTGLSRIAMELSASNVNDTFLYISKLVANATDYATWGFLVVCRDNYNGSLYRITKEGLPSFYEQKYEDAYKSVQFVNQAVVDCNNTILPMLTERNTFLYKFTADTMAILQHFLF